MSSVPPSTYSPRPRAYTDSMEAEIERTQWYDFACILLFFVGLFNVIDGIAAIGDSKYLGHSVLFANLHAWGWFFLIWGIIQIVAAFAVYRGSGWAVIVAIVTCFFNAIAQLSAAKTYPIWSLTLVAIDVLIMYGLIVHRRDREAV